MRRLEDSGAVLNKDFIDDPEKAELYCCTCESYMHYRWCIHVCLLAIARKVMLDYPTLLNPAKIKPVHKKERAHSAAAGRPAKAKNGGALGFL